MREIKFRAFNKKTKEWEFFDFNKLSVGGIRNDFFWLKHWCEFTGLHDKNGKEIYEGDIVNTFFKGKPESRAVVEWDTVNPCFCLRRIPERFGSDYEYDFVCCNLRTVKVIGNVYENPDLLES